MIVEFIKSNGRSFGAMCVLFLLTYGGRWAAAEYDNSSSEDRVDAAIADNTRADQALRDFRENPKPKPKTTMDISGLIAAFQLTSQQMDQLDKTLDTLPFLMDCGAADIWLNSRLSFHESEALAFPEGADPFAMNIERTIESQIRGLDIGLEKECGEFPCSFTLHTETIPVDLLERFHDELALEFETMIFERPVCEDCPEQFLSFGAASDRIPDSAFRRLRWRKTFGGVK